MIEMISMDGLQLRAQSAPWVAGVEFLVKSGDAYGLDITMTNPGPPGQIIKPTFDLGYANAQILMDDLWHAGLRPTEGRGSAGAMAAVEKHLDDMRKIVFNRMKIDIKG